MDYDRVYLDIRKPRFKFNEIVGYKEVKERFYDMVVVPMTQPEALKKAGVKPPTGVIVWGPLGSGKGHMIEAAADETGANYIIIRGRECTDRPSVIRKGFKYAWNHRPCVIHVMDIDWLCPRKDADYAWGDGTTDGKPDKFGSKAVHEAVHKEVAKVAHVPDILVVASCYRIDVLDQAFTRTSMLGRKIYVPRPNAKDREEIFKYYLRGTKIASDVKLKEMARLTEYYVGWDIEALCRRAVINALNRSKNNSPVVSRKDLLAAKGKVKAWLSPEMASSYDRIFSEDCIHKYNF